MTKASDTPEPAGGPHGRFGRLRSLRRLRPWTLLAVLVVVGLAVGQLLRPLPAPRLVLTATPAVVFPAGPVLPWPVGGQASVAALRTGLTGSHGKRVPVPIADLAEVMTAYVVLRDHPLKPGEQGPPVDGRLTEYQALELMLLASAGDSAALLARWDAGSESAFAARIQQSAGRLRMRSSSYTDPSGRDPATRSTAADQLRLAEAVLTDQVFRAIVAQPSAQVAGRTVGNANGLPASRAGTIGIKLGSSPTAGGCLLWAAVKNADSTEQLIVGAVLGQPDADTAQRVSAALVAASQDALTAQTPVHQGQVVGYLDDGLDRRVPVAAAGDLTVAGWPGLTARLHLRGHDLARSSPAGTDVGTLTAGSAQVAVVSRAALVAPDLFDRLTRLG